VGVAAMTTTYSFEGWMTGEKLAPAHNVEYARDGYLHCVDTTDQSCVLVLPAKPHDGFKIIVQDKFSSWEASPLVIHRNGNKIMGMEEHLTCDLKNQVFALVYTTTSAGWVVTQDLKINKSRKD
jgi:hypothetical protein